ncbi:MarR family transcriptional regulator [Brachybacterium sp. JHP9]|uniref:MarR family transcriptional regulator n=1 Tax=Brachybacterium equifaecis TaxID=2910770 RepID=A0ABT0QZB4_9MICO|nr:MarR family transcriptional regulator [Brachybacterium equifaecis]MCL6422859.1 MarR family transcriptional regulator [Brachybacterium equifaecis]
MQTTDEAEAAATPKAAETTAGAVAAEPPAAAPATEWLTPAEQQAWRRFLFGVNFLMENVSAALEQDPEIDLSLDEYEILVRLSESEGGRIRMSGLADQVVHSRSRLTHTIARLEKRGIVERVRCSADGRGREAVLTAAGIDLLRRAAPVHVQSVRDLLLDVIGSADLLELGRILGATLPEDAPVTLGTSGPHSEV